MSKSTYVVSGEAPESESEEEINHPATTGSPISLEKFKSSRTPQGIVVAGEAPESDEEQGDISKTNETILSTSNPNPTLNMQLITPEKIVKRKCELRHKSLLHRKLRERNVLLRKDITEFVHQTVTSAGRDLNTSNQQLLRSQVQLQEAVTAINSLNSYSIQLNNKLTAALSSSFIPTINLPQ